MLSLHDHVQVFENGKAVAQAAAAAFRDYHELASRSDRRLPCGRLDTEAALQAFARAGQLGLIPWDRVHWFWGDERGNAGMARRVFLGHAPTPIENVHLVTIDRHSPEQSAELYQTELKRFYGAAEFDPARPLFDLVLLGLERTGIQLPSFPARMHWKSASAGRLLSRRRVRSPTFRV